MNNFNINLSDEILLIIECSKEEPSYIYIKKYINQIKNWNNFIFLVKSHGVLPLVYNSLKSCENLDLPSFVMNKLKELYFIIAKENMMLSSELIKVTKAFDFMDIDYISFKGPTLSKLSYGNIIQRQYCDLDILIKYKDIKSVINLLKEFEYESEYSNLNEINLKYIKVISFYNKKLGTEIEIHCELISSTYAINLDSIDFFNLTNNIKIYNNNIKSFNKEFLFIYLCIHGSKHIYERISWITDINKCLIDKTFNWKLIVKFAKELNIERIVYSSIYLASITFDTSLPNYIKSNMTDINKLRSISENILSSIDKNDKISLRSLSILLSQREGLCKKINLILKSFFYIKETDIKFIKLPKYLYFIYFIVRPFRILSKKSIK